MTPPTVTLPIPPAWIAHADKLALHVVSNTGGVTDIIRFRVVKGEVVLEYPPSVEAINQQVEAEQRAAQEQAAQMLADECDVSLAEAWAALRSCQWSVARARRRLAPWLLP